MSSQLSAGKSVQSIKKAENQPKRCLESVFKGNNQGQGGGTSTTTSSTCSVLSAKSKSEPKIEPLCATTVYAPASATANLTFYDNSFGTTTAPIYSSAKTNYPPPSFVPNPVIPATVHSNPCIHSRGLASSYSPSMYNSPPRYHPTPSSIYKDFKTSRPFSNPGAEYLEWFSNSSNRSQNQFPKRQAPEPKSKKDNHDPLAFYFDLPSNLFCSPRKSTNFDPNDFIDAFCDLENNVEDLDFILDLEFGHPRRPVKRPLATYDPQSCNITCKDSKMTHPGFSKCNEKLQRSLLLFYDSIVSSWYIAFTAYYGDYSVNNFQDWLKPVMNVYGLCWCGRLK